MTNLMPDSNRARRLAAIGGVLYLIIIAIGASGEALIRGNIVVPGNAAATGANLRTREVLWRWGVAGEGVLLVLGAVLALILYILLRPVNRDLARLAIFFNLVCLAVEAVAAVSLATALLPIGNAAYLTAFTQAQLDAASMLAVRTHSLGFGFALIFFGAECVVLGFLISRSGYMPKTIGVLMQVGGVCYVVNSLALLLSPPLSGLLFPGILLPALVAELSLATWLLVKGVRTAQWDEYEQRTRLAQ